MTQPFSNEVALRIGLAARRLSSVSVGDLIEALQENLGDELDEKSLSKITVSNLKSAFRQTADVDGDEDREDFATADMAAFKDAVRILWGETSEQEKTPPLEAYAAGDMPGSVRVAVASNSSEQLDGHFGSALRFLIYQVSPTEVRLVDARPTLEADLTSDKNAYRVKLIQDAAVLYTVSIGGPAAAKVIKSDIHIMPVPDGGPARDILAKLQAVLAKKPPPWLVKRQAGLRSSTLDS
jgi:nitrogen fixation protein NifX